MERKKLAPGVFITPLDAEKFNRCRITIHLRYPALRRSATDAAVLPLVLERGPELDERVKAVEHFEKTGELNLNANIQFGEGGAGTFSDGKLTTGTHDPRISAVLDALIDAGAPADVRWSHKPHIGTDLLKGVVTSIRQRIQQL